MQVYVVYSQDQIDEHCSVFIEDVYESEEEAERAANVCDGWVVIRKLIRKSA
jgi:hypothetical protein